MPLQVRTTLSPGLQRLHHASTTSPITSISSQCQRRHKSDGPREGTGKVGYDKFRPVDRRDMKMPAQQSMQVSQKMQMRKNMPNDLGLLLGQSLTISLLQISVLTILRHAHSPAQHARPLLLPKTTPSDGIPTLRQAWKRPDYSLFLQLDSEATAQDPLLQDRFYGTSIT
jgi:hypothetical protein